MAITKWSIQAPWSKKSPRRDGCPFRKSYPDVMVVQAGQDWDGDNGAGPLDCPTQRRVFTQGQVRTDLIVIRRIRRKNLPQMRFAKDQHPVHSTRDARCQSDAPRTDFAKAIQARSVGRGCPSPSRVT